MATKVKEIGAGSKTPPNLESAANAGDRGAIDQAKKVLEEMMSAKSLLGLGTEESLLSGSGLFGGKPMSMATMAPFALADFKKGRKLEGALKLAAGYFAGDDNMLLAVALFAAASYLGKARDHGMTESDAIKGLFGAAKEKAGTLGSELKGLTGEVMPAPTRGTASPSLFPVPAGNSARRTLGAIYNRSTRATPGRIQALPQPVLGLAA